MNRGRPRTPPRNKKKNEGGITKTDTATRSKDSKIRKGILSKERHHREKDKKEFKLMQPQQQQQQQQQEEQQQQQQEEQQQQQQEHEQHKQQETLLYIHNELYEDLGYSSNDADFNYLSGVAYLNFWQFANIYDIPLPNLNWNNTQLIDSKNFILIITHIYNFWLILREHNLWLIRREQAETNKKYIIFYIKKMYYNAKFILDHGDIKSDWKNFFIIYNEMNKSNTPYISVTDRNENYLQNQAPKDNEKIFNYENVRKIIETKQSDESKQGGKKRKKQTKRRRKKCCAGPGCPEWEHCINVLGDGDKWKPKSEATLEIMKKCGTRYGLGSDKYKTCVKDERKKRKKKKKQTKKPKRRKGKSTKKSKRRKGRKRRKTRKR